MASSNPFRRKQPSSSSDNRTSSIDSIDVPRALVPILHDDDDSSGARAHAKKKTPKKVRVLSPPPRSPDPPEAMMEDNARPSSLELFARTFPQDPFDPSIGAGDGEPPNKSTGIDALPQPAISWPQPQATGQEPESGSKLEAQAQLPALTGAVANPFSKTLRGVSEPKQEAMEGAESPKPANAGSRRSLNVDSFRRLLLTGAASPPKSPPPPSSSSSSGSDQSEAEAISSDSGLGATRTLETIYANLPYRDSLAEHPLNAEAIQEVTSPVQLGREKKAPPPPPSSRHGKALKIIAKEVNLGVSISQDDLSTPPVLTQQSLAPVSRSSTSGSDGDSSETSLSQDSLIKALNLELTKSTKRDQDLSNCLASPPSSGSKKPVPAPPPRRGHARTESRASGISRPQSALSPQDSEPPSRTSMESFHSRPGSIRQGFTAPVPPPPRRPTTGSRQSFIASSATISSPPGALPHAEHDHYTTVPESPTAQPTKPSTKPPPPPSRQRSTRRPPSTHSMEQSSRRGSAEGKIRESMTFSPPPPPPPPSRRRGSSQSSLNGPPAVTGLDGTTTTTTAMQRSSFDSYNGVQAVADVKPRSSSPPVPANESKSYDILADLDALQREVDALRGKMS